MMFTINELCDACCNDNIKTVKDMNDTAHDGDTPLMWLIDCDDIEVVRYQRRYEKRNVLNFQLEIL